MGEIVALAPAGMLLFLGSAWFDVLWPFQIGFFGAIAFGLSAILALRRRDSVGDAVGCCCLLLALGWSGLSLPFFACAGAGLAVQGRLWRKIWIVVVPLTAYLVWFAKYGDQGGHFAENIARAPAYMFRMASAAISGLTGLSAGVGQSLVVVLAVIAVIRLWQLGRGSELAWQGLAGGLAFWCITALARAHDNEPAASRYIYPSVLFILMLACGLLPKGIKGRRTIAIVLGLALLTIPPNLAELQRGREDMLFTSQVVSAELGAVELARDVVSPAFTPELNDFYGVPAWAFLAAIDRYESSPAYSPVEIARSPEVVRLRADRTLIAAMRLQSRRAGRSTVAAVRRAAQRDKGAVRRGCKFVEGHIRANVAFAPGSTMVIGTGASGALVQLRRFARSFSSRALRVPARGWHSIAIPKDPAKYAWHAILLARRPLRALLICRAQRAEA